MSQGHDFTSRSHALWRMRMAHFQQRFGFFSKLILASTGAGSLIWSQFTLPPYAYTVAVQCLGGKLLTMLGEMTGKDMEMNVALQGHRATIPARFAASDPMFTEQLCAVIWAVLIGAVLGLALGILVVWLIQRTMSSQGQDTLADRVLGGTRLLSEEEAVELASLHADDSALSIGPVPIARRIETRHFAFLGTTGSGKTTVLRQMLDGIEARGEAALVYDTSGEFIAHYYDPTRGDIILNPFDARCAFWSPFDEISHPADADRIARPAGLRNRQPG